MTIPPNIPLWSRLRKKTTRVTKNSSPADETSDLRRNSERIPTQSRIVLRQPLGWRATGHRTRGGVVGAAVAGACYLAARSIITHRAPLVGTRR